MSIKLLTPAGVIDCGKKQVEFKVRAQFGDFKVLYPGAYNQADFIIYISVAPRIHIGVGNINSIWGDVQGLCYSVSKYCSYLRGIPQEQKLMIRRNQIIGRLILCP